MGLYDILSLSMKDLLKGAKGEVGSGTDSWTGANEISIDGTADLSSTVTISIILNTRCLGDYLTWFFEVRQRMKGR